MEANNNYGIVSPPWWSTDPLWIVGGGASADGFVPPKDVRVLAVNDAVFPLCRLADATPFPLAVFSLDHRWVRCQRDFLAAFRGEKYVAVPLESWPDCADIPGVTYLQRKSYSGLSECSAEIHSGGNSGYGALNLAYLKLATEIHLIGFDLNPNPRHPEYDVWAGNFYSALSQLSLRRVKVLNHNPYSAISAFPKVPYVFC